MKKETVKVDPSSSKTAAAKTDNSFFTQPKKKALPSFKKVPLAKREDAGAVSQPSSFDPFQEALNAMTKGSGVTASAAVTAANAGMGASTPPSAISESMDMVVDGPTRPPVDPLKRKKSVSFRPNEELEAIRWISKADYGDDEDGDEETEVCFFCPIEMMKNAWSRIRVAENESCLL